MKLLRFATLVCAMALLLALPAGASDAPAVLLDGEPLSFGVPPTVDRQRVLVPFRALFEALGYDVDWDGPTRSVTAAGGGGDALEGTHSVLLREKLYDPLVVGNYIYYYGAAGLCRTPTAGGAEEVVYAPTAANLS